MICGLKNGVHYIEIFDTDHAEIFSSTKVVNQNGDEIVGEDQVVEGLCQHVFNQEHWFVGKNFIPIQELSRHYTELPRAIVRWACVHDVIDGAEKPYGYWEIPQEVLKQLNEHIELADSQILTTTPANKKRACYLEDVGEVTLGQLPEQVRVLLATHNGFGISLFEPDTASVFISKKGSQIHIIVEHFVDISKWANDEWTYSRYVKTLAEQAQRRNIKSKYQTDIRNGRETVDGISFHFVEAVEPEITLQELINKVLQNLSKIVATAEQSLDGGPIWDDINDEKYQKNEDSFCQEILTPLLKKMGFGYVRYTHGTKEYGRDFYFEYNTPFGKPISFGVQVKRGNLTGRANAEISTILEQIERAFENPYIKKDENLGTEVNISIMIVAISGKFTDDAVQVIRSKLPRYFPKGSVYFWDKHIIKDLIALYWGRSNK